MRLTDESGNLWMAHFHHIRLDLIQAIKLIGLSPEEYVKRGLALPTHATFCTLHSGKCAKNERPCGTEPKFEGRALCSRLDAFLRWKGRKIAFTRALHNVHVKNTDGRSSTAEQDKVRRTALWKSYLAHFGIAPSTGDAPLIPVAKLLPCSMPTVIEGGKHATSL